MTTAFGFGQPPDTSIPTLPETADTLALAEHNAKTLPAPAPPTTQVMPTQEPGTRPRRA